MSRFLSCVVAGEGDSYAVGVAPRPDFPEDTNCYAKNQYYDIYYVDDVFGGQIRHQHPSLRHLPPYYPDGGADYVVQLVPGPTPFYDPASYTFTSLATTTGFGQWILGTDGEIGRVAYNANPGPVRDHAEWLYDLGSPMWLCYGVLRGHTGGPLLNLFEQGWSIEGSEDGSAWSVLADEAQVAATGESAINPQNGFLLLKPHRVRYVKLVTDYIDPRADSLFYVPGAYVTIFTLYRQGVHR